MKTASYLSSARVYSLVMFLALYFNLDAAATQSHLNVMLQNSRKAFAVEYLRDPSNTSSTRPQDVPGVGTVTVTPSERVPDPEGWGATDGWSLAVHRNDGGRWRLLIAKGSVSAPTPKDSLEGLRRIAVEAGLKESHKADFMSLYHDIERALTERKLTIPGVGLAFGPDVTPWIVAVLTLAVLILIRNQIKRVIMDTDLAMDEPWIILDGEEGLEKLLAAVWLMAIFLAPWVANACLLAVFSGQMIVEGSVSTWPIDLLACACTLFLIPLGGWASLTTTSDLLRLRHLRRLKLKQTMQSRSE